MTGNSEVLTVIEEPDISELVEYNLNRAGLRVDSASLWSQANEKIRNNGHYSAAIVQMSYVYGTEDDQSGHIDHFIKELQAREVPVFVMSAHPLAELRELTGNQLIDDDFYMQMPFSPKALVDTVMQYASNHYDPE